MRPPGRPLNRWDFGFDPFFFDADFTPPEILLLIPFFNFMSNGRIGLEDTFAFEMSFVVERKYFISWFEGFPHL